MRQDKVIQLGSVTITEDDIGNQVETLTWRTVFASELYVGSNEYYNAALAGLRPEKRFEVYTREYQGETKLKHNNVTYRIIRTETRGEKTRLSCERVAADG